MPEGQRIVIKLLLQELHALGLFNNFATLPCDSRFHVSATLLTDFKLMFGNLHHGKSTG